MKAPKAKSKPYSPTPGELAWAKRSLNEVLVTCFLNVKLRNSRLCSKYLHEMSDLEFKRYEEQVQELRALRAHQLPTLKLPDLS